MPFLSKAWNVYNPPLVVVLCCYKNPQLCTLLGNSSALMGLLYWHLFFLFKALQRIMDRDKLSEDKASQRISSQMSNEERVQRSHVVLCTLWEPEYTQQQVTAAAPSSVGWWPSNSILFYASCYSHLKGGFPNLQTQTPVWGRKAGTGGVPGPSLKKLQKCDIQGKIQV